MRLITKRNLIGWRRGEKDEKIYSISFYDEAGEHEIEMSEKQFADLKKAIIAHANPYSPNNKI